MPFVCERFEKFLINSIHFILTCDFDRLRYMGYCERRYKGTCIAKITMVSLLFGVRGRFWLELRVKIYYKSYMPFVCERFEKF